MGVVISLKVLNYVHIALILITIYGSITYVSSDNTTTSATTITEPTTTTEEPLNCGLRNSSCDECVKTSACYYCNKDQTCRLYPSGIKTLQPQKECGSLSDMSWQTCLVKFNTLLIIFGSIGGFVLLFLTICCCCCCRKVNRIKVQHQLTKWERQRQDKQAAQQERREEREAKREELRQKYGLSTLTSNNKYSRFD